MGSNTTVDLDRVKEQQKNRKPDIPSCTLCLQILFLIRWQNIRWSRVLNVSFAETADHLPFQQSISKCDFWRSTVLACVFISQILTFFEKATTRPELRMVFCFRFIFLLLIAIKLESNILKGNRFFVHGILFFKNEYFI